MKYNKHIAYYHQHADTFAKQYTSVAFEDVHNDWLSLIPPLTSGNILDIGAGAGRDAKALASMGNQVTAIEPASALMQLGSRLTGSSVTWVNDTLPLLTSQKKHRYDLILVSAVWMHLTHVQQQQSLQRCSQLLLTDGHLVITLRHGEFDDARVATPVNATSTIEFAKSCGLTMLHNIASNDKLQRRRVNWQTLVFTK
ncbi:class I SAM-dependent methyltransferase [Alteromonas sp. 1_MG-2023]|uniref:class I SAM-dependent methyltransferase n=1 Tax=Alteromonas sp. 1_MG-2023 TaxID=3062669 RepID=UPI0026E37F7E|nr:class I SAM-dependent methyltransferase [Alteromonas sp. 1_MG-2023]MDO6566605.1 class I SAM-dependent methyltransferase [Alteromonas sp. 1_MG-2023]